MKTITIITIIWSNFKIWTNKILGRTHRILPYKILINLTNNCNSKCEYCDIWTIRDFSDEIKLKDIIKLFDEMGDDLVWLALSGGEVTLVKYLDSMLFEAKKRCKNLKIITFTTNALLPKRVIELSNMIKGLGFDLMVTISLDGDRELHDQVRGVPGNYSKCIKLYDNLKQKGVNVNFGITVSDKNHNYVKKEYKTMRHLIKAVTFVHDGGIYMKSNNINKNAVRNSLIHIYNNYALDSISEIIEYIHIKISIFFMSEKYKTNLIPCEVINASIHIMENGSIRPCMFLDEIGNIKHNRIGDVIFGDKANDIREKINNNQCPHCWMNCYSPYSIMQHPFKSVRYLFKKIA